MTSLAISFLRFTSQVVQIPAATTVPCLLALASVKGFKINPAEISDYQRHQLKDTDLKGVAGISLFYSVALSLFLGLQGTGVGLSLGALHLFRKAITCKRSQLPRDTMMAPKLAKSAIATVAFIALSHYALKGRLLPIIGAINPASTVISASILSVVVAFLLLCDKRKKSTALLSLTTSIAASFFLPSPHATVIGIVLSSNFFDIYYP
jgi:hypothetical protein